MYISLEEKKSQYKYRQEGGGDNKAEKNNAKFKHNQNI